jgi:ribosome maturation factor RimP
MVLSELKQHFVILPRFSGIWEQKKLIRLFEMVEITFPEEEAQHLLRSRRRRKDTVRMEVLTDASRCVGSSLNKEK